MKNFIKKLLIICLVLTSLPIFARDISERNMARFTQSFKHQLREHSYLGLFCYVSETQRRIVGSNDFDKEIKLADSSNIITNYLAYKLEQKDKFDRDADLRKYAQVFNYKAKKITFSDLLSSTAGISKHLDKIYPKDAPSYEYFEFLSQLNPDLMANSDYAQSKISNLGAIYALSYSQSKKTDDLLPTYKNLVKQYLNPAFPSLELLKTDDILDVQISMSLRDFAEYLSREVESFSANPPSRIKNGDSYNAWIFSEILDTEFAMTAGFNDGTYLIAIFYDYDIAVAFFVDDFQSEKSKNFIAASLQEFVRALKR